ncbi:hypothetical protein BGZ65_003727 [Modicella reniformis]|uniref:Nonsense-mediated mRNA decay factor SMG8 n=1 Tax=Modicella reniformis TaxID=1440133 RepID=A0A9P6MLE8_9FUNG|nr:hypothetical protein BGZ65_003727 [Modicella reniformis]
MGDDWTTALGLSPDSPVHVVGYFGQTRDLSIFERVPNGAIKDDHMVVYCDEFADSHEDGSDQNTGDIHVYVDRSKNMLMLQHAYLFDTQEMLTACLASMDIVKRDVVVYTSPDMNIDPQMISVLNALSAIKRQIMQELDRFMAICWDRIGVSSPEKYHQQHQQQNGSTSGNSGHSGRNPNSVPNIFTPGKCVPVLVFVIERVPVVVPWHEPGISDSQAAEHLKQQVLKKSIDALQTRLRYVFRACRLIQSIDPPGMFDVRQLFVLPSPSSMPFVHVIPQFIGQLHLPSVPAIGEDVVDPAEAVLQKKSKGMRGGHKKHGAAKNVSGKSAKNQETIGEGSLLPLYLEYTGPLLKKFVESWTISVSTQGGYGNVLAKRSAGMTIEAPSLKQWVAGCLILCEGIGIKSFSPPMVNKDPCSNSSLTSDDLPNEQEQLSSKANVINSKRSKGHTGSGSNSGGGGGRRSGSGKRYSTRSSTMVQKKIRDYIQTDDVMEEL